MGAGIVRKRNDGLGRVKSDNWGSTVQMRQPRLMPDGRVAGANKRNVWTVASQPFSGGAHFAVMPEKLVEPCILAGSRAFDLILDPFSGVATVPYVAKRRGAALFRY